MAKSGMNIAKARQTVSNAKKIAQKLNEQNVQIIKTIEQMNQNIYHGGKTANDWYLSADASCESNKNFLKQLNVLLENLQKQINNTTNAGKGSSVQKLSSGMSTQNTDDWNVNMTIVQ